MFRFFRSKEAAKMQCLQDPNQINIDNLNNGRLEASRHFRNTKKAYLKAKIEELENNSNIKNIRDLYRGISDFKKGYQPRTNIVYDEKVDLVADPSIFWLGGGHFLSAIEYAWVNDVRQTELHTADQLVPELSAFEVDLAIEKLKSYKSPGIDQSPAELIKAGG